MTAKWISRARETWLSGRKGTAIAQDEDICLQGAEARFFQTFGGHGNKRSSLFLGRIAATGSPVEIPLEELTGVSKWCVGSTGSGKSVYALGEAMQWLGHKMPITVLDAKSELIPWMKNIFVPALASTWSEEEQAAFFGSYRLIAPFDPDNLPELNVLAPVPGVPASLQAKEITVLVSEAVGAESGPRMETILNYGLLLAIGLGGLSFLELRSALTNRGYLDQLLRFSTNQDVREYFCFRFPKESPASLHAVVSRLDNLLLLEDTARVLCARGCVDAAEWLEDGATLIDVGNAPRGAEFLTQFWMAVFVRALARAILSRPMTVNSLPVFCLLDEFWVGLDQDLAMHFERLLALCRYKRVSLGLYHQLASQVGSKFPGLLATLKNSCGVQAIFRQSFEDARSFEHALPTTGNRLVAVERGRPWDRRLATPEEERRLAVNELARLPDRHFYYYFKKKGLEAVHLVAPTVDFAKAEAAADRAPADVRTAAFGRGKNASREARDRVLEARRAHVAKVAAGHAETPAPTWETRPGDVVAKRAGRSELGVAEPARAVVGGDLGTSVPVAVEIEPPPESGEPADSDSTFFLG